MSKAKRTTIEAQGTAIGVLSQPDGDYISLTDMVRNFDGAGALIEQWLRNKYTVLFVGVRERINNPRINSLEFERIDSRQNFLSQSPHYLTKNWPCLHALRLCQRLRASDDGGCHTSYIA